MRKYLHLTFTTLFLFSFLISNAQANRETGDNPSERYKYAFEMEKDPALGYVPYHRLLNAINHTVALKAAQKNGNTNNAGNAQSTPLTWIERGPIYDSVGPSNGNTRGGPNTAGGYTSGRIRAFLLDTLNDPSGNTAFTGGVAGGLWKCTNFLSADNNWTPIDDRLDNLAVSSIAQDPSNPQNIYISTGEPTDNADRVIGLGVWKSTNGGTTFTHLPSTANYMRGFKIGCDAAGNVYLASRTTTTPVNQQNGLIRSTNGGTTWTNITPSDLNASTGSSCTDFEFTSSGILNATFGYRGPGNRVEHRYSATPTTVAPGTWLTGNGFRISNAAAIRTEMAVAGEVLYAVTVNTAYHTDSCYKSIDGGANWTKQNTTIMPSGLGSGQGWYNLSVAINPLNTNEVISGGLDAYRSTNGGANWTRFTYWVTTAPYVHADHHYAQYWIAGGQTRMILATDGGVFYSADNGSTFSHKNKNLGIKQFYSAAIHPAAGSPYLLAGAQDNGTHQLSNPGLSYSIEVTGGDGMICHINQMNPQIQYGSYVYNQYRRSVNGGATWQSVNLSTTGLFVNPFDYDDAQNIMYCSNGATGAIRRWVNANTSNTNTVITLSNLGATTSLTSVKYSPHTANRVFFGTNAGTLYRLDDANTVTSPSGTAVNISGASFPTGTIICVNTGTDDNNLVATYSNYGVNNVWVTTNGGTSWTAVDGDLPDMPVRWAMFEPGTNTKLFLATEAGIYTTTNINGASTQWLPETTFPTVSTYMLKMRTSDSTIVAGTHGRGLWTAKIPPTTSIAPTVTINQAAAQPDPTTVSPINFTVVFDQAVTGFATGDVTLSGTAGATTGTVTGSGTTYNVAVSGMTSSGTVIATIPAGVCVNGANEPNAASTSTDNTVTFTLCVTNPIVTNNANAGAGSLRQAVIDACPGSTITFNMATVTSPITLTTGEISILKNLTIQGPGAALLTINGGGSGRIFYVAGAGITGNINDLTLTGGTGAGAVNTGRGGAAYNNLANMNLTNMVITGNTAANGGGINTAGAGSITTITNSTISNNTSTSSGGGLQNFSTSTTHVIGSTISGNSTTGSFGGAAQANGTTTFTNSTISGNTASTSGAGLYFNGPSATIINSTITNNTTTGVGGGINKIGTNPLNIRNTLIAGNNGGATAPDVSGTIVSQGFNLVGRVDGSTGFTQPTDLTGTIAAPLNPMIGTLANNGGRTLTHALLTGSPAIDKGSAANYPVSTLPIITDQRDSIRPYDYPAIPDAAGGNGSDIGAYELKDVVGCTPPTMNPVPSDTVCNNAIHPAINFTSSTPGTTFSWTNNNTTIGLGASGTGNIAAFTATNPGAAPVVATITVTPSIGAGSSIPTPELFYYDFDGTGTSVPNLASAPPAGTATATIVGGQTQGTTGMCGAGALVGNGLTSTSNYVNTNWATSFGTSSWTISFKTSNIPPSATLFYIFGDPGAGSLRCFTNGVAGPNNWLLRGPMTDVLVTGGATVAPHTITFVYDNTLNNIRAYLDGALVNTVAQAALNINGAGPFKVGGYGSNVGLPAGGIMDEFRIYNRALTPAEVTLVAGCPAAGPPCNGPSQTFTITVDPSPSVNPVPNQTVCAGAPTAPVNFTGIPAGATFSWTNNTPSIGLAASGTGNIASFIAQNATALPVTATITVTPSTGGSTTPVTIPLPAQNGTFTGNVRGYWFTAPTNFTMTALRVPTDASSGNQSIAVVRFNPATPPPAFPGTTNAFTTLFLSQNNPAAGNIPVNIQINAGDVIGILGQRATVNSYAPGPANTTIAGFPVTLTRMGMQFPLTTTAPQQLWQESAFQISRVFFDYTVGGAGGCVGTPRSFTITVSPNPGIVILADPGTTICQGDPTLLTVVTGSSTPVGTLYTQGTGTPANGSPSQVFEPANAAFSSQAADDFIVPAGATWSVSQITTSGINTAGGVPTSVNVFFYANSGSNLPGAAIASYTNLLTFVRTGANYVVTLPAPLNLTGGTYWMSFQVNMSFATSGQWFWGNFGTTNIGNQYAWQNPGGGFATPCTSWGYGSTGCGVGGGVNRNNYFSIIGSSVTGGAPLPPGYTFLWSPAAGLSSTTSNPVAASPMTTTNYTVVVNNGAGCTRQASILITVNQRPTVTAQPANSTNCVGNTATFTVGATGTGLVYQWQVSPTGCAGTWTNLTNAAPYSGVNTATLTVTPVTQLLSGYAYRCVLTGVCAPIGTANISNCAVLTVNPNPNVSITPPVSCGGVAGIYGTELSVGSAPPPVPGTVTVSSGTINLPIPDNTANGVSSIIAMAGVPANATITGISVALNMPHTYPHDMVFNLRAPNGQILSLYKHHSNTTAFPPASIPNAGWYNAVVNSSSTTAFGAVPTPFRYGETAPAGPYRADALNGVTSPGYTIMDPAGFVSNANSFNDLYTTPASTTGNWTLAMCDGGPADFGTLVSWSITIDYTTPGGGGGPTLTYVWSPLAGLYTNATATTPYTGGNTSVVYAAPTALTVYTVRATDVATGCFTDATAIVNYTPPAPTVVPSSVTMCLGDPAVKLKSSSSTTLMSTFSSGTISVPIPEGAFPTGPYNAGISTIPVSGIPAGANISRLNVRMNITHAFVGDVVAVLQAPNGQRLNLDALLNLTNNAGANFVNTVISSAGTTALSAGTAPWTGTFRADLAGATFVVFGFTLPGGPIGYIPTTQTWPALYGTPNGNWTLALYDAGAPDVGTLTNWSLDIEYVIGVPATPAVWSPAAGLFSDAAATVPYVAGTAVDSVWTRPTPSGVYPYQVTVQSMPVASTFTNPANIVINAAGAATPYPSNITVSGLPTSGVSVQSVILTGMSHTWGDDIDILLQSPTGQNVVLMSDVGGTVAVPNATYTFVDGAPAMNPTAANPTGTYRPTNNGAADNWPAPGPGAITQAAPALSMFTGNVNGAWRLFVFDDVGGDAGNISGGYTINFNVSIPPCTSPARTVIVTVNQPTTVTTQPVNQTICTDKVATFTAAGGGSGPFTYQWQVSTNSGNPPWTNITNGGVYSGATSATLTITQPPVSMSGNFYRVIITGAAPCAAATSFSARLIVNPLPTVVISASPYTSLFPGLTTTLSSTVTPNAVATGGYVWLRNGVQVGGSTATLPVDIDGLGDYQLRVTDVNGCTNTSNTITIKDSVSGKCFIYPNPTSGKFQVRYYSVANNVLPRTLTIYDAKGDRVFTQYYTIGRPYDRMDVDMRAYGKGLYWVEIGDLNGNRITMCRVVIQ